MINQNTTKIMILLSAIIKSQTLQFKKYMYCLFHSEARHHALLRTSSSWTGIFNTSAMDHKTQGSYYVFESRISKKTRKTLFSIFYLKKTLKTQFFEPIAKTTSLTNTFQTLFKASVYSQ